MDPAELAADIDSAVQVVDAFWTRHWSDYFTGTYQAPTVIGLYDGTDPDPSLPTCGGETLPAFNALYCVTGDFVAWDVGLMAVGLEVGDGWVYLIIAHEWAHAIQARVDATLNARASELQADCLAAAALYGAAEDGLLQFEDGDVREITVTLSAAADETPWTNSSDHGDVSQRTAAFELGRADGVKGCLPINS